MVQDAPPGDARLYFALPSPFPMKRGGQLHDAHIAYETWGELNPAHDNAVLILTGLSLEDVANAARAVVSGLCRIGCLIGGMSALAYMLLHPGSARTHLRPHRSITTGNPCRRPTTGKNPDSPLSYYTRPK